MATLLYARLPTTGGRVRAERVGFTPGGQLFLSQTSTRTTPQVCCIFCVGGNPIIQSRKLAPLSLRDQTHAFSRAYTRLACEPGLRPCLLPL